MISSGAWSKNIVAQKTVELAFSKSDQEIQDT